MILTAGAVLIAAILWDAFETVVLPRRVTRRLRITRIYLRSLWRLWSLIARALRDGPRRESYLGLFGPLSLILLLATWAVGVIFGFALVHWDAASLVDSAGVTPGFWAALYYSGTTFFTLGLGDLVPWNGIGRTATVMESGTGFVLLALVIGYVPVLYQAFSRREVEIAMLDEWAGSPSSAGELLRRLGTRGDVDAVSAFLTKWEEWAAEILESHISYPILCAFRSQHSNQSWLSGLTTVLDTCALVLSSLSTPAARQAQLTFAMARHVAVDLSLVLDVPPQAPPQDRLPPDTLARLHTTLRDAGLVVRKDEDAGTTLAHLRAMYEPYVYGLSTRFFLPLPQWLSTTGARDNWQKSKWD